MKKQILPIILTIIITAIIASSGTYFALKLTNTSSLFNGSFKDALDAHIISDGIKYATVEPLSSSNVKKLEILYGDITGDNKEDAVVTIPSGGTAGNLGVLVYSIVNKQVILIDKIEGYKIGAEIQNNQLITTVPYYLETDANCCPSFFNITTYAWNGKKFIALNTKRVSFNEFNKK